MCDQDHFEQDRQRYDALGMVTRRQFGVLVGAGISMMLPQVVNAVAVTESDVEIKTTDGTADCILYTRPAAVRPPFSSGPTSSDCAPRSGRWGSALPSPAIPSWW